MKKLIYCAAVLSLSIGSFALADSSSPSHENKRELNRMDCRYYGEKQHSCTASATYWVTNGHKISDIRYGVSCDRQTIYNNGGTYMPQEQVSDGIRPTTAAVPRVELTPQFALRNPGTYTSKLEIGDAQLLNGVCYVNTIYEHDDSSSGSGSGSGSGSDSDSDSGSDHSDDGDSHSGDGTAHH
jgi:hypothetical protein